MSENRKAEHDERCINQVVHNTITWVPHSLVTIQNVGQSPNQSWVPQGTIVGTLRPLSLRVGQQCRNQTS